jgi:hypothetical protein
MDYEIAKVGRRWLVEFEIDIGDRKWQRRLFSPRCIDWIKRLPHVGGALGEAMADRLFALKWIRRGKKARGQSDRARTPRAATGARIKHLKHQRGLSCLSRDQCACDLPLRLKVRARARLPVRNSVRLQTLRRNASLPLPFAYLSGF